MAVMVETAVEPMVFLWLTTQRLSFPATRSSPCAAGMAGWVAMAVTAGMVAMALQVRMAGLVARAVLAGMVGVPSGF